MIDTVTISIRLNAVPDRRELERFGWLPYVDRNSGEKNGWYLNERFGAGAPFYRMFKSFNVHYLSVRVSLPAFQNGANIHLFESEHDVQVAVSELLNDAKRATGIEIDPISAVVWEAHFTRDIQVGELMIPIILDRLRTMPFAGFETGGHGATTLYFGVPRRAMRKAKVAARSIAFYSKHAEQLYKSASSEIIAQSRGLLRIEYRLKLSGIRWLKRKLFLVDRSPASILSAQVAEYLLDPLASLVSKLVRDPSIQRKLADLLKFTKPPTKVYRHLVFLAAFGPKYYVYAELGISRSTYYACEKIRREMGLWVPRFALDNNVDDGPSFGD